MIKKILLITLSSIVLAGLSGCAANDTNSAPKTLSQAQTAFTSSIQDTENFATGTWSTNSLPSTPQSCSTTNVRSGQSYQYASASAYQYNPEGFISLMKKHLEDKGYNVTTSQTSLPATYHVTVKEPDGFSLDVSANLNSTVIQGNSACVQ